MTTENTASNQNHSIHDIIQFFKENGQRVQGVYELLVRGSASADAPTSNEALSDLDLSIILEAITPKSLAEAKELYKSLKWLFSDKLSLTIVSREDFVGRFHYHGIKPLYYSYRLAKADFLLGTSPHPIDKPDLKALQKDCLSNIAYLIHDLRGRFLKLDEKSERDVHDCFMHLVKRSKHLIRNGIFIIRGHQSENIPLEKFIYCFPTLTENDLKFLESCKHKFHKYEKNHDFISDIWMIFGIIEEAHRTIVRFSHKNL